MEVTRLNFQEAMEELDSVIDNASFLAIDSEFTGLNSGPEAKPFDTPAEYYRKLHCGSTNFLLVQFGLSVFTYDAQSNKYNQRSYNFYVFPRPLNKSAPDCRFTCQASSIAFLADNGFDFNKLFNLGIPYLTMADEEKLNNKMKERQAMKEDVLDVIPIPDADKEQIKEICSKIDEFLDSNAEELSIDRCNPFIRRVIHQEARARWPKKVRLQAKYDRGMQSLLVYKMGTKKEEEIREAEQLKKDKQEIKNAVGLSVLLRKISESGKTIVGHNMLLDLFHMIHQFFGPLPDSYKEFKSLVHDLFPRLMDTKIICKAPGVEEKIPSSILDGILDAVMKKPFSLPDIEPVEGRSYSLASRKYHEAGYDAYVTGLCFIALSNYFGTLENSDCSTVLCDSPLLNPFLNKLTLVRLRDIPHINLVGNDPVPGRDHVFHLTFPGSWKYSDITQLFSPFGGGYVSWLNDTSAYVGLHKREHSPGIIKKLLKDKRMKNCKIQTYADHQKTVEETRGQPMDRRKKSPFGNVATTRKITPERKSESANGDDDAKKSDDVWETVSGKKKRKRKAGGVGEENDVATDFVAKKKSFVENSTWE